jgi:hypothetical protein
VLPREHRHAGAVEDRLYRMVIETRDAILVLNPPAPPPEGSPRGSDILQDLGWCLRSAAATRSPYEAGTLATDVPTSGSDDLRAEADYLARAADLWSSVRTTVRA